MLPSNVDPRRPDKVQRYKPPTANGTGQGEDLTPDYMNILGHRATTANATDAATSAADKYVDGAAVNAESNLQTQQGEEVQSAAPTEDFAEYAVSSNATNVIPTSPQYGVAIISNADVPTEAITISTDTVTDTTAKPPDDNKDLHSTPSKNDRFKVVKIASLEPFKRGRWKCMDYLDEVPNTTSQQTKVGQVGGIPVTGGVYLQTQSLPQQQIQQMLLQGGFTNGTQFFNNQMIPQAQYYYPPGANIQTQTLPQQLVNASGVPSSMPAQFIAASQPYFTGGVVQNSAGFAVAPNYQNVQYVPQNVITNQGSAFVPTSQTVQLPSNFQQSQTYAGQPNVSQSNVPQPMVNGHAYPPNETSTSLPTQAAKNVIINTNVQQPVVSQPQISQSNVSNQIPVQNSTQQTVPVIQNQQYQQNPNFQQQPPQQIPNQAQNINQTQGGVIQVSQVVSVPSQTFDQSQANVYTNPQFDLNVNSATVLENSENSSETVNDISSGAEITSESTDDPSKTNPVVNAIDNKIEQAMDLVKSHLMYTVREEVEVLKEKIAELMERIQQLETENNFLRSQIPKTNTNINAAPSTTNQMSNPSSNVTSSQNPPPTSNPASNSVVSSNLGATNESPQQ